MRQALLASLLIGSTCSLLGVYVVLRRMAFLGDAVAHTTLPGLVIAHLNHWNLFLGAIVAAVVTALGIGWLSRGHRLREDTAIGVIFSGMFALGIVMISRVRSYRDFSHMLFGNVLGVTTADLVGISLVSFLVCAALLLVNKELMLTTVDPLHGESIGLSAERIRYLLLILLALTVVTGIQAVGVVLTTALIVTPAASASMITRRLDRMLLLAVGFSASSSVAGLYASYYLSISSGGAIVLACTILFGVAYLATRVHCRRFPSRWSRTARPVVAHEMAPTADARAAGTLIAPSPILGSERNETGHG
ncbi:MAG: metal ABC transporter permease [Planctomycetes bacterium]|nr:metal ABC transporter permease [Planctomycetota bacterium]